MLRARHKSTRKNSIRFSVPTEYAVPAKFSTHQQGVLQEVLCEEGISLLRFAMAVGMTVDMDKEDVFRQIVSYV